MVLIRLVLFFAVTILVFFVPQTIQAQNLLPYPAATYRVFRTNLSEGLSCSSCSLAARKFLNSFTSYQFPNPFSPQQDPLSRLEFPLDQWFIGIESQYRGSWWSLSGQGWINITRESGLKMQDSDWDDDGRPSQKTVFSESQCRLNTGILLDVAATLGNPVRRYFNFTPLIGLRYQYFFFTTHDGYQTAIGGWPSDLPGDGIDFKQFFYHIYFGGASYTIFNLGTAGIPLTRLRLDVQVDYALVRGRNEDAHLLREGNRVTEQNTSGHCWHVFASLGVLSRDRLNTRIEFDIKRVLTNGGHLLTNSMFDINFSFDGSRVWSDQVSLSGVVEVAL
ncbi:MAG TPA: omptin family outer membrane protease [Desulfomonilaceae bacterium]|nr:omptin family outer membrane protease [Desulfomonilaceae bacterium]